MTQFSSTHQPSRERRRQGQQKHKVLTEALILAINREIVCDGKMTKQLHAMADELSIRAAKGDLAAIKEIFDRIEGKATTVIGGDEERGPVNICVTFDE